MSDLHFRREESFTFEELDHWDGSRYVWVSNTAPFYVDGIRYTRMHGSGGRGAMMSIKHYPDGNHSVCPICGTDPIVTGG